ncbi:MAG: peptidylprolyl isomerase [Candidatus Latescibacteria bacterium]|jgi:peptidyl-prolyl cis-trans isomerase SurA|nr:peptidylprolyl isomerase [Candidatus Latescibacterota bacterium]
MTRFTAGACLSILLLALVLFVAHGPAGAEPQMADRIVAVVDDQIVLQSEVINNLRVVAMQQGENLKSILSDRTRAQEKIDAILRGMVDEKLMIAKAEEDTIEVDEERVEEAVREELRQIKAQYGDEAFAEQLLRENLHERDIRDQLRQKYRKESLKGQMYQMLVQDVEVSYRDVENFRESSRKELPSLVGVSHILIEPERSTDRRTEGLALAEAVLTRLRNGEDFAQLARDFSDDDRTAPAGGDLGFFTKGQMVPAFEEAAFSLAPGEVSEPVETEFGFHLFKAEEVRESEVHVRHILFSLDSAAAHRTAMELHKQIQEGADFADLAREHSADPGSAEGGGNLGVYSLDTLPPAFAEAIRTMKLGDVSLPLRTEFGWHLVKLNDDRDTLEEILQQDRVRKRFREALEEMREKLYVEVHRIVL